MEYVDVSDTLRQALSKVDEHRERSGIGTLGEKTLHLALKYYYEPDVAFHEKKIGRYFADIFTEDGIVEIQTASFQNLKKKLECFLKVSKVTIVYPVAHIKRLIWIDEETGEMSKAKKSPKKGTVYSSLKEIPKLLEFLEHPGLSIKILLLDIDEYRLLNGWSKDKKRGSTRFERVPNALFYEYSLNEISDFSVLIPETLPKQFFSKDFKKATGLSMRDTGFALLMLVKLNLLVRVGKDKNAFVYERNYDME